MVRRGHPARYGGGTPRRVPDGAHRQWQRDHLGAQPRPHAGCPCRRSLRGGSNYLRSDSSHRCLHDRALSAHHIARDTAGWRRRAAESRSKGAPPMTEPLLNVIDSFAGLRVLVIGEAMLDSYLIGTTTRVCREAPVPIVALNERRDVPGGAANAAVNVASLGGCAIFLSAIGDDAEGALLRDALEASGVPTDTLLIEEGRRTLTKHRLVAASQVLVRFDQGDTDAICRFT